MDGMKGPSSWSTWKNPSTRAASLSMLVGVSKDARSSAIRIACDSVSILDRISCNSAHAAVGGVIAVFTMVLAVVGGLTAAFVTLAALGGVRGSFETVLTESFHTLLASVSGATAAFATVGGVEWMMLTTLFLTALTPKRDSKIFAKKPKREWSYYNRAFSRTIKNRFF